MRPKRTRWPSVLLVLGPLLAACGAAEQPPEPAGEPAADTAAAVQGITPEQIAREGEAMSPEEAEALGIVDTTIHVEDLGTEGPLPPEP